jgi:hypothetical protein
MLYLGDWIADGKHLLNTDEHPRVEFWTPVSHRDRRLLHGPILHAYFNKRLSRLPSRGAHFHYPAGQAPPTQAKRRAEQRIVLLENDSRKRIGREHYDAPARSAGRPASASELENEPATPSPIPSLCHLPEPVHRIPVRCRWLRDLQELEDATAVGNFRSWPQSLSSNT